MSTGSITRAGTSVPEDQVVRYTFQERAVHWINGIAYTYSMLTGLALFTPFMFWLATVLGGGATIRFWHPWAGLIFAASVFWMQAMWGGDMKITDDDRKWSKTIESYVTNRDEQVAPAGHFNHGQKQFYLSLIHI